MSFYIAQAISVLTAAAAIITMQFKSMKNILIGQIVINLLAASTYFLLGGFSGAGICFIAIAQTITMFFYNVKNKKPHKAVIIGFILLYFACSAVYYTSPIDIISALAAICFALSIVQTNASGSRIWYSINPLCWVVYDIYTKAYGNLIMHLVIFISTAAAIIRNDIMKKNG